MLAIGQSASAAYRRVGGEWQIADKCLGGHYDTGLHIGNDCIYQFGPTIGSTILTIGKGGIVDRVTVNNQDKIRIAELDGRLYTIEPVNYGRVTINGGIYPVHAREFWNRSESCIVATDQSKCYITTCDGDLPMGDGFESLTVMEDFYELGEKYLWQYPMHTSSLWVDSAVYTTKNTMVGWTVLTVRDPRAEKAETLSITHDYTLRSSYIAGRIPYGLVFGVSDNGSYVSGTEVYDLRNCTTYIGDECPVPQALHVYFV